MSSNGSSDTIMDKMKRAGRSLVDTGSKAMLKTDVIFLEREIKQRKQTFGVEVYESMEALEIDNDMTVEEKEQKIRISFDCARKDIAVTQAKIECKKEEISVFEAQQTVTNKKGFLGDFPANIPPPCGNVVMSAHPSDMR